jgi:GcrA cell cycle regulator
MDFTAADDAAIAEGWKAGKSASAIGLVIGRTKNSVISRKTRLGLESRPSPMRPRAQPKPPMAPRVLKVATAVVEAPKPVRVSSCCWPFDIPGTRKFRFCDAAVYEHGPYCEEHRKRAYLHRSVAA